MFKKLLALAACVLLLSQVTACKKTENKKKSDPIVSQEQTVYPYNFRDTAGNNVTIDSEPVKIVTLGPNITETIFALGKGKILAGRTEYDDYPEEVQVIDTVGDLSNPNIEKIIEIDPDVVLVSGTVMPDYVTQMKSNGLPVVIINDMKSFEGVYDTITLTGNILNANREAYDLVKNIKEKVADVEKKVKDLDKPSVYYIVGYGEYGDYTATGDTFIGLMLEKAGGNNIAKNEKGWTYSKEALINENPDLIICSDRWNTKKGFTSLAGYNELDAVKNNKVLEIDENLVTRQGPRIAEGLYELAKLIHPEAFD